MRRVRPAMVRTALAAVAMAASSCGESENIDVVDLSARLPELVAPAHPEAITDVVCPEEIEREAGATAECTATLSGTPVAITVTQLDGDGSVSVTLDAAPLVIEDLSDDLAAQLSTDLGREVVVACAGPGLIVPEAERQLTCTATDEDGSRDLTVTLLDASGAYEVRFTGS